MNSILVLQQKSHTVKRHLGQIEVQRNVAICINGHTVDTYTEGSQSSHYARGRDFEKLIADRAALLATALGCTIAYAQVQE